MTLLDRADWPSTSHTVVSRDGTKLTVTETGVGQPLVLLHGLGLTGEVWLPQVRALRDRYRVLCLDIRGHGDSGAGVEGYAPELFAEDIAAVLTQLELRNAILVGHSLGGTNIGQFAVQHQEIRAERVSGLVFVSSFASALNGEGWFRERFGRASTRLMAATMGRRKPSDTPPSNRLARAMTRRSLGGTPDEMDVSRLLDIGTRTPAGVAAACALGNLTYDVTDLLSAVDTPALVIVGSRDRTAKPRSAQRLALALPNATLCMLQGVGHPVGLQEPEELIRLIDEFASTKA